MVEELCPLGSGSVLATEASIPQIVDTSVNIHLDLGPVPQR